jgi:hypothetical protein
MLSIKNIKLKVRKLTPKYISPFKILKCIRDLAYKLKLPSLYNRLYLTFYISLFKEYKVKKGQEIYLYPTRELPELLNKDKEQE